ncbi:hypothetical protein DMH02_004330 [Streptomyces sp. WAC 00631]|uniref:hypothetical protein n=1 Tax=Streptomyces sp. WAC 00631 TaxID=2203201 RepID=UPI00163BC421|nr:hypothetical protein [Streptomyces sp. WAC 00631]MCC5032498.1 hypothetical protein [Streptomyces sp. WAC 00631]
MTEHADPALLAELALGNRPSAGEGTEADAGSADGGTEPRAAERHLAACPQCRDTLAALRRIIGAARNVSPDDRVTAPPEALWESIAAELGLTGGPGASGASGASGGGTPGSRLRSRLRRTGPAEPVPVRPAEHPAEPVTAAHSVPLGVVPPEEAVPHSAGGEPAHPEAAEGEPVPARPGGTGRPPGDSTR